MIKLENTQIVGWGPTIRGMRNPMNSWERSDSVFCDNTACDECKYYNEPDCPGQKYSAGDLMYGEVGPNDHELMMSLAKGGPVHAKYRRMIHVYVDVTAPLYWWKEADTYRFGVEKNSCSTMHKIHDKEFTLEDFSCEHLIRPGDNTYVYIRDDKAEEDWSPFEIFNEYLLQMLNACREAYLKTKNKKYWWQMIQLLPSSYNQKRTVDISYETLANIYEYRRNHKLDEWREVCRWIESLPYSEIITQPILEQSKKVDVEEIIKRINVLKVTMPDELLTDNETDYHFGLNAAIGVLEKYKEK